MYVSRLADAEAITPRSDTEACALCGFELWEPIVSLDVSGVGLYDDARFPGRTLVSLSHHYEHLDDLPPELAARFMHDIQTTARALREALSVQRANVAILGNQEPHVHAHVIPRYPETEPRPFNAPWQDTRQRHPLTDTDRHRLIPQLRLHLIAAAATR